MGKRIIILIASLTMLLMIPISAFASDYHTYASRLVDNQDALSTSEFTELYELLDETAQKSGVNVGVILADTYMDGMGEAGFTEQFMYDSFGYDSNSIVLMLVTAGSGKVDQISMCGEADDRYRSSRDNIFDRVYIGLDSGSGDNYPAAIREFCDYLSSHHGSTDFGIDINLGNIVGIVIAIFISVAVINGMAAGYKKKTPVSARAYIDGNSMHFTQKSDTFVREYTTSHRVSSSSSSGSSGGGSHRSGGHRSSTGGGRRR